MNAKVTNVLEKNTRLAQIKAIKNIHTSLSSEVLLDIDLSPSDIVNIKFSLITSVKWLKWHIVMQCNQYL